MGYSILKTLKSTSGHVFILGGVEVFSKSWKQTCTTRSTGERVQNAMYNSKSQHIHHKHNTIDNYSLLILSL